MRLTAFVRPILAVGLPLLAAACGSSETGPSFAGSVDSTTVVLAAEDADALLFNTLDFAFGGQYIGSPYPGFLTKGPGADTPAARGLAILDHFRLLTDLHGGAAPYGALAQARFPAPAATLVMAADCPTLTGADSLGLPIDSDHDGIPDNYSETYGPACAADEGGGYIYSFSGSWRIKDTGTGFASFAFTASAFQAKLENPNTGDLPLLQRVDGTESATFVHSHAEHLMDISFTSEVETNTDSGSVVIKSKESSNFTPTSGTLTLGGDLPPGDFLYSADFQLLGSKSFGAVPGDFHFLFSTPTGLTYDPACGTELTGGTFLGLLNGKETIGFQSAWTGCADPTITYFGFSE